MKRTVAILGTIVAAVVIVAVMFPAADAQEAAGGGGARPSDQALSRLSQGSLIRHWQAHPEQAPQPLGERLQTLEQATPQDVARPASQAALPVPVGVGTLFNRDELGLPQNEESVTACRSTPNVVVGGTNDFRGGFIDPEGNITGWHFSDDGGRSVRNEGWLPPVEIGGQAVPSGGDPVVVADDECNLYAGSINNNLEDPFNNPNGIGVYRTTPQTLSSCPGDSSLQCWPTRRAVAVNEPGHFLDKEWIHVGRSGEADTVVWIVYTDFAIDEAAPLGFTASIQAVRCSADLEECTDPILISGDDEDVQFGDVTIAPDGRVFVTWSEIQGEREGEPQTFIHKLRVAEPGSTFFGPERVVAEEDLAIPFGPADFPKVLNANDFRAATYPKNEVRMIDGESRAFVVWDACRARVFNGSVCEEPVIKLTSSDDLGESWSETKVISKSGANYFPSISNDRDGPNLVIAYFTNRFDRRFDNRQDVELVTLNPRTLDMVNRRRLTPRSNEPEADPLLGGFFIGDYIEVFALRNRALVHYNANYRQVHLLGEGLPVPQQDNYVKRTRLGR